MKHLPHLLPAMATLLITLPVVADDNLRSGHSLTPTTTDRQITISVTVMTVPEEDFVPPTQRITARPIPQPAPIQPPEVTAKDLDQAGGIQLISATTIIEQRQLIFAETISAEQKQKMIQAAQSSERSNTLFAPKVTVFDQQTATIRDISSRPFVMAVDFENADTTSQEPAPSIVTIEEGTSFAFRSTIRRNDVVQLDLEARFTKLQDVNALSSGDGLAGMLPTVRESSVRLAANVESGETLAVWGFETTQQVRKVNGALKNVPYASRLFNTEEVAEQPLQLLLFVTPTIIETPVVVEE